MIYLKPLKIKKKDELIKKYGTDTCNYIPRTQTKIFFVILLSENLIYMSAAALDTDV